MESDWEYKIPAVPVNGLILLFKYLNMDEYEYIYLEPRTLQMRKENEHSSNIIEKKPGTRN